MIMKLPDSGSWLAAALSGLGQPAADPGNTAVADVSEAQVTDALDALARGDIEFVILEEGDAFLQVAGDGEGPYQVEYCAGDANDMVSVPGGVDRQTARQMLLTYRRADPGWRAPHQWQKLE
jgi:hypothetical protein